ncbi:hypothetical protein GOP47_0010170, partial [Adiantum capillus-veneris]
MEEPPYQVVVKEIKSSMLVSEALIDIEAGDGYAMQNRICKEESFTWMEMLIVCMKTIVGYRLQLAVIVKFDPDLSYLNNNVVEHECSAREVGNDGAAKYCLSTRKLEA